MPYIKQSDRETLQAIKPTTAGELNYMITCLCLGFLEVNGNEPGYSGYNEVIGALECCKLEFYRRAVVPYEKKKIKENGDVYNV
jgi:hypothetical protein